MKPFGSVGLTIKSDFDHQRESVQAIVDILSECGVHIYFDSKRVDRLECGTQFPTFSSNTEVDVVLVIGGDGTILRSIREMQDFSTPLLSVNRGTVGFLAEIELEEAATLLPLLLAGEGILDERELVQVTVSRSGEIINQGIALNEAVLAQGMIARLVNLRTEVNGEPLTTFHADGLIISTPTGSTAYSLSAGGPIVHPTLSAMILTPINPHSFAQKPVVIRGDATVSVEVLAKESKFSDAANVLTLDGQVYIPLQNKDVIAVSRHKETLKFLRRKQDTFFGTLREKLKWGESVEG